MVKQLRVWNLVAVGLVLGILSGPVRAAPPATAGEKTPCPKECERKAKAALALAATAPTSAVSVVTPAPAPRPKEKHCDGHCNCPDCGSRPDACPAPKELAPTGQAVPQPMPARREFWAGVGTVELRNGTWHLIDPCPTGRCPNR